MRRQIIEGEPRPTSLPLLRPALDLWVVSGGQDDSLLRERWEILEGAQIPMSVLGSIYLHAKQLDGLAIIEHRASISAASKSKILTERGLEVYRQIAVHGGDIKPIKTITLTLGSEEASKGILVAGAGDFRLSDQIKEEIAEVVGLSRRVGRRAKINNSAAISGLPPGIVGPYRGVLDSRLAGIVYLDSKSRPTRKVAVAPTFWETLVVAESVLVIAALNQHAEHNKGVFFRAISVE